MMKRVFLIVMAVLSANMSYSQIVTGVDAWQEGKDIVITYSIEGADHLPNTAQLSVVPSFSVDGGRTYYSMKSVSGDLKTAPGAGKKITWNVLNDFNEFVQQNVLFKVEISSADDNSASLAGLDYYRKGLECERTKKYAEAIKYYRLASRNGYKQADERIRALQLYFW